jgi:hypothetical protein
MSLSTNEILETLRSEISWTINLVFAVNRERDYSSPTPSMSSPNSNEHFDDRFSISSETLAATRISLARAFDWVAEADQERLNQRASRIRAIRAEWRDAGWDDDGPWCPQEMVTREYDRQRALNSAAILSESFHRHLS